MERPPVVVGSLYETCAHGIFAVSRLLSQPENSFVRVETLSGLEKALLPSESLIRIIPLEKAREILDWEQTAISIELHELSDALQNTENQDAFRQNILQGGE